MVALPVNPIFSQGGDQEDLSYQAGLGKKSYQHSISSWVW
jgi:hypothetical protein